MMILHTADWHLNDRLGRIDRTEDLRRAVERVAGICKRDQVDVLVVAGDLFSEMARPDALRETIEHWQKLFTPFLTAGGTILTITGNHDNENFCRTLQHAMTLAAPLTYTPGEVVPTGRLYLAAEPTFLTLRHADDEVQFVLMPYPTMARYIHGDVAKKYRTPGEKNRLLSEAFLARHQQLREHPRFAVRLPSVLVAHITAHGSDLHDGLFRLSETEDVTVNIEPFLTQYQYIALGHIHKPQSIGANHARYSGSIEHLDLGERRNTCGVVLVEVNTTGITEPKILPLPATPIHEITIHNPTTELPRLREQFPEPTTDLVNLHIRYTPGEHLLEELLAELETLFPRWYARDWTATTRLGETLVPEDANPGQSVRETVNGYVEQELQNESDSVRTGVLGLLQEILSNHKHDAR
jgi:DNA repair protein SbcD/Mre11